MQTITRPGLWMWASFDHNTQTQQIEVRVYEADDRDLTRTPPSLQVLGLVLAALHRANGGHAEHAEDKVAANQHTSLALPGGRVQSVNIWPVDADGQPYEPAKAAELIGQALDDARAKAMAMVGVLGKVEWAYGDMVGRKVEIAYGPTVVLEATGLALPVAAPATPPKNGKLVELEATLRPAAHLTVK